MKLTYQSLAIACAIAFATSWFFTLLRIIQFISVMKRGAKNKIADIVGLICLILSTTCVSAIFGLDKYMSTNSLKNMGKPFMLPSGEGYVSWGRLPENNLVSIE
jgi:choline-glycine betaine transporter